MEPTQEQQKNQDRNRASAGEGLWQEQFKRVSEANRLSDRSAAHWAMSQSMLATAEALFQRNDSRMVDSLRETAIAAHSSRRFARADELFGRAIEAKTGALDSSMNSVERDLADLFSRRAQSALALDETEPARQHLEKSVQILETLRDAGLERERLKYARVLFLCGNVSEGTRQISACLMNRRADADPVDLGQTISEMAAELINLKRPAAALQLVAGAELLLSSSSRPVQLDDSFAYLKARALCSEGKAGEAAASLQTYIDGRLVTSCRESDLYSLQRLLCRFYRQAGNPGAADRSALSLLSGMKQRLPPQDGRLVPFHLLAAEQMASNFKYTNALKLVDEALKLPRCDADVHRSLLNLLSALQGTRGDREKAGQVLGKMRTLLEAFPSDPNEPPNMLHVRMAMLNEEPERAEEMLDTIIDSSDLLTDNLPAQVTEALFLKAELLLGREDFAGALQELARLEDDMRDRPEDYESPGALNIGLMKASCQMALEDLPAAEQTLDKLEQRIKQWKLEFGPTYGQFLLLRAEVLHAQGRSEEAEQLRAAGGAEFVDFRRMNDEEEEPEG